MQRNADERTKTRWRAGRWMKDASRYNVRWVPFLCSNPEGSDDTQKPEADCGNRAAADRLLPRDKAHPPPTLPPSPSPRLPFTWSGYHANQHWTVSPFSPLSSPPSTPPLLSPSLPPSSPTTPNSPPPPPPPPQPTDPTPAALLLEKGPISWLQIEHGPAVDFHRSVIMITHIVSRRCGYCRCRAKRTWKQNVFLMSQAKQMLPEKW